LPRIQPPSLLALRAFEAAARRLSFTEAARELHVSQAAVSRHIRALEKNLGRELFRRLHRAVELTPHGRRLAGKLAAGFDLINRAVDAARGTAAGRLRLTVEPAFAARWLAPRLDGFQALHPDIELELETSDVIRTLGRDADIAIRFLYARSPRPRTRFRPLFAIDAAPVIARQSVRGADLGDDAEVLQHRLLHDDDGRAWRQWFAAAGLAGFEGARHLYFTDHSLAIAAALRGQGVALGSSRFIAPELATGGLATIGRTRTAFGDYLLLEAAQRASARNRAAFVRWFEGELRREDAAQFAAPR
jgi:DNA-binding transcriptional LysR family regulator